MANKRILLRRDTRENWTLNNPILENGEIGVILEGAAHSTMKIGDGSTRWNDIPEFQRTEGSVENILLNYYNKEEIAELLGQLKLEIGEDYQRVDYEYTNESVNFENIEPGDAFDTAFNKIESNLSTLTSEIVKNELVTAGALTTLDNKISEAKKDGGYSTKYPNGVNFDDCLETGVCAYTPAEINGINENWTLFVDSTFDTDGDGKTGYYHLTQTIIGRTGSVTGEIFKRLGWYKKENGAIVDLNFLKWQWISGDYSLEDENEWHAILDTTTDTITGVNPLLWKTPVVGVSIILPHQSSDGQMALSYRSNDFIGIVTHDYIYTFSIYENEDNWVLDGKTPIYSERFALKDDLSNKQNTISDLETIRQGAELGKTALQAKDLPNTLPNPNNLIIQKSGTTIATYDGSSETTVNISFTASDLGLSSALKYCGITTTSLTDGSTTNPIKINDVDHTATSGCVVFFGDKEFIFNGSKWEEFGYPIDLSSYASTTWVGNNYKPKQTAVSEPTASGNSTSFIDTISQNANGVISVTKKNVDFSKYTEKTDLSRVATTGSYNDLVDRPNIPAEVTKTTIENWGFTENIGTITGITMNGSSKGTNGVVNLGTVITDISGKQDKLTSGSTIKTINGESLLGSGNISVGSNQNLLKNSNFDLFNGNYLKYFTKDTEVELEKSNVVTNGYLGNNSFRISYSMPNTVIRYELPFDINPGDTFTLSCMARTSELNTTPDNLSNIGFIVRLPNPDPGTLGSSWSNSWEFYNSSSVLYNSWSNPDQTNYSRVNAPFKFFSANTWEKKEVSFKYLGTTPYTASNRATITIYKWWNDSNGTTTRTGDISQIKLETGLFSTPYLKHQDDSSELAAQMIREEILKTLNTPI